MSKHKPTVRGIIYTNLRKDGQWINWLGLINEMLDLKPVKLEDCRNFDATEITSL